MPIARVERKADRYLLLRGYVPVQSLVGTDIIPVAFGGVAHSVFDGLNGWIRNGRMETALGPGGSGSVGAGIPVLMNVANGYGGMTGAGSVIQYYTQYLYAGSGSMYAPGVSGAALSGTSITEIPVGGGTPAPVGIAAPTVAPVIAPSAATGKNLGSYSILYTYIRSATGEESNRSPISNVVTVSNKAVDLTSFGAPPGGQNIDKLGIYCSFANFSTLGPWFHLVDISTGTSLPYTITLPNSTPGWYNGDLGVIAPLDYNVPPPCSFVFSLNDIVVAAGCYPLGGNGLSPSVPGKFGAFPPEFVAFLPGGGNITACKSTADGGMALVSTANSLYLVTPTTASSTPIDIKQMWPTVGFASGNNFTMVESEIYGFSGQRGLVRTQGFGAPDTTWARDANERIVQLGATTSNTVVIYDPSTDCILVCFGTHCFPYDRKFQHWHTDQTINSITSGVTSQGVGLLENSGGSLQALELGSGTSGFVTTASRDAELPGISKTYCRFRAVGTAAFTFDFIKDPSTIPSGTSVLTISNLTTNPKSAVQKINIRDTTDMAIKASWTNLARQSLAEMIVQVVPHPAGI